MGQSGFFREAPDGRLRQTQPGKSRTSEVTWAEAIQELIEHGHDKRAIGEYTLLELLLYLKAIMNNKERKLAEMIAAINTGAWGDKKTISNILNRLTKGGSQ